MKSGCLLPSPQLQKPHYYLKNENKQTVRKWTYKCVHDNLYS